MRLSQISFSSLTFLLTQRDTWSFIITSTRIFRGGFRDGAFSTVIYTPAITALWHRYGVGPTSLTSGPVVKVCLLINGWLRCAAPQRRHPVLPNRGDSLQGSLWKLTAQHGQLDLRFFYFFTATQLFTHPDQ